MAFDPAGAPLLNISEFAAAIGVDRKTVFNWLRRGTCPVAPVPAARPAKWRRADVAAFLAPVGDA